MTSLMNFFGIQPSDKKQRDKLANMMKVDKDLLAKFEAACEPHHPSVNAMDGASGVLGPRLISTVGPRLRN